MDATDHDSIDAESTMLQAFAHQDPAAVVEQKVVSGPEQIWQDRIDRWLERAFQPLHFRQTILQRPVIVLGIVALILIGVMALPLVQYWMWHHWLISIHQRALENREITKLWMDSSALLLEIVIALGLGESYFGDDYTRTYKERMQQLQQLMETKTERGLTEAEDTFRHLNKDVFRVISETEHLFTTRELLHHNSWSQGVWLAKMYFILPHKIYWAAFHQYPRASLKATIVAVFSAFPGGLAGFMTFCTFVLLSGVKVSLLYMDSLVLVWPGKG